MRKVQSDADCADCLCRVCARNEHNDSYNKQVEEDQSYCTACDGCNGYVIDLPEDCPKESFLPDENESVMEGSTDKIDMNGEEEESYKIEDMRYEIGGIDDEPWSEGVYFNCGYCHETVIDQDEHHVYYERCPFCHKKIDWDGW